MTVNYRARPNISHTHKAIIPHLLSTASLRSVHIGSVPNVCGCRWKPSWRRASFPLFAHLATPRRSSRTRSLPWGGSRTPPLHFCSVVASFHGNYSSVSCSSRHGRVKDLCSSGVPPNVAITCFGRRWAYLLLSQVKPKPQLNH